MPTVVDIVSSELNSPIPVHFSSLIPKMSMFTLAVSCGRTDVEAETPICWPLDVTLLEKTLTTSKS